MSHDDYIEGGLDCDGDLERQRLGLKGVGLEGREHQPLKSVSKELKRRGWSFVGPTGIYAFMQGVGIVDDHLHGCAIRTRVEAVRTRFLRPV